MKITTAFKPGLKDNITDRALALIFFTLIPLKGVYKGQVSISPL